ncbi:MAG TPA: hypothetical protein VJT75_08305 [Thermoleophilaceae bacterium]|nr:hypothetical protein [Thermoleophilaceae bacterium]
MVSAVALAVSPVPAQALLVYQRPATSEIVAARDDGTQRRVIAYGKTPIVAPDGKRVAFVTKRGSDYDLKVVTLHDGQVRLLLRNILPGDPAHAFAWSPDGRSIAIGSAIEFREALVDVDKRTHRYLKLGGTPGSATFSPDSTKVLFELVHPRDKDLLIARVADGGARFVDSGGSPTWGAVGFAYRRDPKGILFRKHAEANPTIARSRGHAQPRDWSADGDSLLAVGGRAPADRRALLIDRRTGHTLFLPQRFTAIEDLSRNGHAVLGEAAGNVVAARRDGSSKVLARNATTPSWTK